MVDLREWRTPRDGGSTQDDLIDPLAKGQRPI